MKSLKEWKALQETTDVPLTSESEEPTADDFQFYNTMLNGRIKRYLDWLTQELEKKGAKLSLIRKGFIVQEVMEALGLQPNQITRLSNNIKRAAAQAQAAANKPPVVQPGQVQNNMMNQH